MKGLSDIRVIDFTRDICGAYCTKLLIDGGAEVIKVEPPSGDPLRKWSATGADLSHDDGALFRFLSASKRSVIGSPNDAQVQALIATADLVVEDFGPGGPLDHAALRAQYPSIVVLSISAYGLSGPIADRPTSEFIVQAESGSTLYRGRPDQPPIQGGGRISDWTAGCYAAPAALGAVWRARRTGEGDHLDFSIIEVMAIAASTFADVSNHLSGRPELTTICRNLETPSIEPAKDGWIGFNTNTGQMFQSLLIMIERPDLLDDADLATFSGRVRRIEEWNQIVHAWTREHTCAEIMALAADLRVPCSQVYDGETIFSNEHLRERGVFIDNPAGFKQPRPPYLIHDQQVRAIGAAPKLGEHSDAIAPRPPIVVRPPKAAKNARPFEGLKVLDVTSWWAGPSSTHLLAMMGAETWHIESITHPDGMRMTGYMFGRPDWWEWGHMFAAAETNKYGVTLDVDQPAGRAMLDELIKAADIVVENFSPRVAEKWGLTWDNIHALNPRAIFMRMPAFGLSGPWRNRQGFAQNMEQLTGMAWLTGHVDDQPRILRGPCDPIAGMHGATALLVGLWEREQTGKGVFIESTMCEAALNCAAEQIIEFSAYGNKMMRAGNRSPYAAPQGVYACAGFEQWLAISITTDDQWRALCRALGSPGWTASVDRHRDQDLIDKELGEWAVDRDVDSTVEYLISFGIPAARLWDPRVQSFHPQLIARGFYETVPHPSLGPHPVPSLPYKLRDIERWTTMGAPTLGEHSREVLARVLGKTDAQLDEFEAQGIIGTRPKGL